MQPIPSPLLAPCAQLASGQKIAIFCQRKSYVLNAHRLMLVTLKQKRRQKSDMQPSKPNDPLHATSNKKLKIALKSVRQCKKQQRRELKRFKQQLSKESVTLNKEQQDGLHTIMNENTPTKPLAQLFWKEQCKAFQVKGNRGMKWHPMMIRLALLRHSKSKAAYNLLWDTDVLRLPLGRQR